MHMVFQFPNINFLYLLASLLALLLCYLTRSQSRDRAARHWTATMVGIVLWTAGEFLANLGTTLSWQLAFQRLVYLGEIFSIVNWLLFAIHFSGNQRWLTRKAMAVLLAVPVLGLILISTVEWHTLFYRGVALEERDGYLVLALDYGVGFWVQLLLCSYLYTLAGSALMIATSLRQASVYRNQAALIVTAAVIPLVISIVHVFGDDFMGGFDPTSLFFVFSAVLITIATRHFFFLRLAPMARDLVFRNINSAVLVLNEARQVTDVNPAFSEIARLDLDQLIGMSIEDVLTATFDTRALHQSESGYSGRLISRYRARQFELSSMPIRGYHNEVLGMLLLLSDVTQIQRALEEISRLAHTDLLTELPNRRALVDWFEDLSEIELMFRPVLVAMADLDHFKRLNDTHGHHCGDFVLKEIGALINRHLGTGDIVARWGGEEFCLVLTGRDWQQGEEFLDMLRKAIQDQVFHYEGQSIHVTVTFGMVQREPGEELEYSIKRADLMMYDGKRKGRNTVASGSDSQRAQ